MYIKIDLVKLDKETAKAGRVAACYYISERETTEGEKLARDILAPLAVAELMRKEGNKHQKHTAAKLGKMFLNCGAVCGSALWFCGDSDEAQALTLADGFRVRAFGQVSRGGCFVLILENSEEIERAYLVRPSW